MLRASGARVVLTTSDLVDAIPDVPTTLALDQLHQLDDPPELARPALTGSHAACVMFTSGSSGTPKAIVLEHANLVSFALNPVLPQLYSGDRVGRSPASPSTPSTSSCGTPWRPAPSWSCCPRSPIWWRPTSSVR